MTPDNPRYTRQMIVEGIGPEGQRRLSASTVAIVGCGALGSLTAMQLAGAGIGHIIIADFDTVSISNLHRQLFFTTADEGQKKCILLARRMKELNPEVDVECIDGRIDRNEAEKLVAKADVIIDGSDNPATKYLLEEVCIANCKPFIVGGINGWRGQILTCLKGSTPLSAIFPDPTQEPTPHSTFHAPHSSSLSPIPVTGPTPGVAASILSAEALKILTGAGAPLTDRLLLFDLAAATFTTLPVS